MKNIFRALLFALMIGVLAYFAIYVINSRSLRNPIENKKPTVAETLDDEADKVAQKMEKRKEDLQKIIRKANDVVSDQEQGGGNNVSPQILKSYEEPLADTTDAMPPGERMQTYANTAVEMEAKAEAETRPADSPELLKPVPKPAKQAKTDETPAGPEADGPYRIQLGVHKPNSDLNQYRALANLGDLFTEPAPNGNNRVLLGVFDYKSEADGALKQVKNAGFKDAFVSRQNKVDLNVPSAPAEESHAITYATDAAESGEQPAMTFGSDAYDSPRTIKIGVFSEPPMKQLQALNDLGQINMQLTPSGFTSVVLGVYTDPDDAGYMLKTVRQRGFPDAFIAKAPQMMCGETATEPLRYGSREWMIQIGASKNPTSFKQYEGLSTLGGIYVEYSEKSGVSKVLLGPYYNETMAKEALGLAKSYGHRDAFLINNKAGETEGKRVKIFDASAGSFR